MECLFNWLDRLIENIELNKIKKCSILANKLNIEVHAGHGLDYKTTKILSKIKEIEEFNIWKDPAKAKEMLQRTNGARTIPQIFIGDHYVGGNDQLQEANRNGNLDGLLNN